jgi:hypothetical protein
VKPYALHADGSPSIAAVFEKDPSTSWQDVNPERIKPWVAGMYGAQDAELTVCVEEKDPTPGGPLYCSYYGARLTLLGRNYEVRVIETALGKVLADESFSTDNRVGVCPPSVTGSFTEYVSYEPRLASILSRFEPESAKLPTPELSALNEVCMGTGIPQAKKPGDKGVLRVIYFPTATTSFVTDDWPDGLVEGSSDKDVTQYAYVMCVTGKPEVKKKSCDYLGTTNRLGTYDGSFDVELREAQTGKVVEKKTFKGASSGCPDTYKFKGPDDQRILTIEPKFRKYEQSIAARSAPLPLSSR